MTTADDLRAARKCSQYGCDADATFRYTWPGKDEAAACQSCGVKLRMVAGAIGLHLQLIPIAAAEAKP